MKKSCDWLYFIDDVEDVLPGVSAQAPPPHFRGGGSLPDLEIIQAGEEGLQIRNLKSEILFYV